MGNFIGISSFFDLCLGRRETSSDPAPLLRYPPRERRVVVMRGGNQEEADEESASNWARRTGREGLVQSPRPGLLEDRLRAPVPVYDASRSPIILSYLSRGAHWSKGTDYVIESTPPAPPSTPLIGGRPRTTSGDHCLENVDYMLL